MSAFGGKADMALVTQSGPCTLREQHNTAKLNGLPHVFCHLEWLPRKAMIKVRWQI